MRILTRRHAVISIAFGLSVVAVILMALTDPGVRFRLGDTITKDPREVKLLALNEVTSVVGFLREGYAYPDRLLPRAMLLASLRSLQDNIPSLLVTEKPIGEEEAVESVTLRLGEEDHSWDLVRVGDLYAMNWKLMEIMGRFAPFLEQKDEELEDQLLAGMLSTLDPHTVYLDERALQEMQMSTSGKFGGLGIVISVREGRLRILSVMDDTPAKEAGLRKGDNIVQVEEESTESMTVSEAASRLRGKPGTTVTIWISRKGVKAPRRMVIERRVIRVRSVEARMLPGGVAYVWVKNFQKGTTEEVQSFLTDHRRGITGGLVLDLRDDSGGIMQEAIKLSDLFLAEGVIVSTRSRLEGEEEVDSATLGDPWEETPLVVLVNQSSASASEIVAGALKMSGRATLVGRRTFGKGSIQYLRELGRGALKMTVAQYLTPGDVSVQASGIQPHVELIPMFLDEAVVDLSIPPREAMGEEDLPNRLRAASDIPDPNPPLVQVHYLVADFEEREDDALPDPDSIRPGGAEDDNGDKALQVALLLLDAAAGRSMVGERLVELALPGLDAISVAEHDALATVLNTRGVTWEPRTTVPGPDEITARIQAPAQPIKAGEEAKAWLRVQNRGGQVLDGLHGVVFSSMRDFGGQDCVIGRLEPGETRRCQVPLTPAAWSPDRVDLLWMDLYSMDEPLQSVGPVNVRTQAASRPRFAVSWYVDEVGGAGVGPGSNGLVEAGEEFELVVVLWNQGEGPLPEGTVTVKPLVEGRLYVARGRAGVVDLAAGTRTTVTFRIRAREVKTEGPVELKLWVTDTTHRRSFSWTLSLPLHPAGALPVATAAGVVAVAREVIVRGAPTIDGPILGVVPAGARLSVTGSADGWQRVRLGGGLQGWLPNDRVRPVDGAGPPAPSFEELPALYQPDFELESVHPADGVGDADTCRIRGIVDYGPHAGDDQLLAAYVNGEKRSVVSFRKDRAEPRGLHRFSLELPLEVGTNRIVLSAIRKGQSQSFVELIYNRVR